jgi:DNA-binding CsgD family transcriptional regulator
MPTLLRAIREFVGADSAGFFWVDAKGDMTNLYADRMLSPGLIRLYFERHYDGPEAQFRNTFLRRSNQVDPVSTSTATSGFLKTAYYNEILKHLDAHHVMYAVIRDQAHAIGQLSLYRPRSASAFTAGERAAVRDISRYVAHAVSLPRQVEPDTKFVDSDDEGMVVADGNGTILHGASTSLNLLAMATQRNFNPANPSLAPGDQVPPIVMKLIDQLNRILAGEEMQAPRDQTHGQWGRFSLSAYALDDQGADSASRVAIHVRRKEQLIVRLAEAMGNLDLSPQQREVALLLAQGKSNQEISAALNVSGNTASYHIRRLFQRLDAHDRAEVVSRILGTD